jgi:hypothetical protein
MRLSGGSAVTIAAALSFFAGNADAQGFDPTIAGTLNAGWSYSASPGNSAQDLGGRSIQDWSGGGAAVLSLSNPGFNVQLNLNDSDLQLPRLNTAPSVGINAWAYGGDVFWRDYAGSTGINAEFSHVTVGATTGATQALDTFGWFGQFFALPDLTLEAKGGYIQGHDEGWYGDVGAAYYLMPDVALEPALDYGKFEHMGHQLRDVSLSLEYMPAREIPVSMSLGYDYADYSQFHPQRVNIFLVGLKVYLGGAGRSGSLVEYQRNGTTNWDGPSSSLLELGL